MDLVQSYTASAFQQFPSRSHDFCMCSAASCVPGCPWFGLGFPLCEPAGIETASWMPGNMCNRTHTQNFATEHDTAAATLQEILQLGHVPATSLAIAHLPLSSGGLGLTSASILASSAHWASWADSLPILQQQLPNLTAQILPHLQRAEWTAPNWTDRLDGARPSTELAQEDPEPHSPPWLATNCRDPGPPPFSNGRTCRPGDARVSIRPLCQQSFHHSALRSRLRLPQPPLPSPLATQASFPPPSRCTCLSVPSRFIDALGDHRAACPRSKALRSRGTPLDRAAARVCREAGARVTIHTPFFQISTSPPSTATTTDVLKANPHNAEDNKLARRSGMREGPKNGRAQNLSSQVAAAWSFLALKPEAVGAKKLQGSSATAAHATFTALAASLLCEDTSSHNNVDGFLPPRSEYPAHSLETDQ